MSLQDHAFDYIVFTNDESEHMTTSLETTESDSTCIIFGPVFDNYTVLKIYVDIPDRIDIDELNESSIAAQINEKHEFKDMDEVYKFYAGILDENDCFVDLDYHYDYIDGFDEYKELFYNITTSNDYKLYISQLIKINEYNPIGIKTEYIKYMYGIDNIECFDLHRFINGETNLCIVYMSSSDDHKIQLLNENIDKYENIKITVIIPNENITVNNIPNHHEIKIEYIKFKPRTLQFGYGEYFDFYEPRDFIEGVDYNDTMTRDFNIMLRSNYNVEYDDIADELCGDEYARYEINEKYVKNIFMKPFSRQYIDNMKCILNTSAMNIYLHDYMDFVTKKREVQLCTHFTFKFDNYMKYNTDTLASKMISELYNGDECICECVELVVNSIYNIDIEYKDTITKYGDLINEIDNNYYINFDNMDNENIHKIINYYTIRGDYKLIKYCINMKMNIEQYYNLLLTPTVYRLLENSGCEQIYEFSNLNILIYNHNTEHNKHVKTSRQCHFREI